MRFLYLLIVIAFAAEDKLTKLDESEINKRLGVCFFYEVSGLLLATLRLGQSGTFYMTQILEKGSTSAEMYLLELQSLSSTCASTTTGI